ncbi:Vacuolar protein-sorting-associated protein 60, partial [Spiromyces aspiralis]
MADLLDQANEVQELMGRSYSLPDDVDEADLEAGKRTDHTESIHCWLAELEALGDDLDIELEEPSYLDEPAIPSKLTDPLPDVPTESSTKQPSGEIPATVAMSTSSEQQQQQQQA